METQSTYFPSSKGAAFVARLQTTIATFLLLMVAMSLRATSIDYTHQVTQSWLFPDPLVWVGAQPPSQTESSEVLGVVGVFNSGGVQAGYLALGKFLAEHPHSAWTPDLEVHLAGYYRSEGRYTQALSHWETVWETTKNSKDIAGQKIAVEAFAGWTRLLASLGETQKLKTLFKELDTLHLPLGASATTIQETREGLAAMHAKPGNSYRCGSDALGHLAMTLQLNHQVVRRLFETDSPNGGFTMSELLALAETNGLAVEAVRRPIGAKLVIPGVVHWKLNHYAAIVEEKNDRYLVKDPTFEGQVWMDAATIDAESSGDFILPKDQVPQGWRKLSQAECENIYGKGYPNVQNDPKDHGPTPPCDDADDEDPDCDTPSSNDGAGGDGSPNPPPCVCGMPQWSVSEPYITLWLEDVPLFYHESVGTMRLKLRYKHRGDPRSSRIAGFGDKWYCNWLGALVIPGGTNYMGLVTNLLSTGGVEVYAASTPDYQSGRVYNGGDVVTSPTGEQNVYGYPLVFADGTIYYFLSERLDRYGRIEEQFNYQTNTSNSAVQLMSVVDKDGRTTTLAYGNASFPNLITSVTDPYGRSAHFYYDTWGRLTGSVDAQGMSNSFQVDSSDYIYTINTPYGATAFQYYEGNDTNDNNALSRALLITEPTGDHQLYSYRDDSPGEEVPNGDGWRYVRLSYHWNRAQYQAIKSTSFTNILDLTLADYQKASVKHWLHGDPTKEITSSVADTMDSQADAYDTVQGARPNGLIYSYEGERPPYISDGNPGALKRVTAISVRSVSLMAIGRNDLGRPTSYTYYSNGGNPQATYNSFYDSSGTILQYETGPRGELTRGYGYDPIVPALLDFVTNAVGDSIRYTHDLATLKVTSITFPTGLVRTNIYYSSGPEAGFLEIQSDIGFRTNSFAWLNGDMVAKTNELGLVTTYSYDSLNRLTGAAYPDGTTTSNVYNNLDVVGVKDRLNQWTLYNYNSLRQLIAVTNANAQVTAYDYCGCGAPDQVIRWNGGTALTTSLYYNMGGLLTNISYPDYYQLYYAYDIQDRVQSVADNDGHLLNLNWLQYGVRHKIQAATLGDWQLLTCEFDEYGRLTNSVDKNNVTTAMTYDYLDRLTSRQWIDTYDGTTPTEYFGYSARGLTNYMDALGHMTSFLRDISGRVLAETNANQELLQFTYNPANELLSLTDGKTQTTSWGYDQYGRVTNKVDNAGVTDFVSQYDFDSRLTSRWTPAKGTTVYRYDPIGNLTNVDYSGGTNLMSGIFFAYDALNRLTNMLDSLGNTAFTWTPGDQLAVENGPWPNDAVNYSYDVGSRQRIGMSISAPNASTWAQTYGYDSDMRLSTVISPAGAFGYPYYPLYGGDRPGIISLPVGQYGASVNNSYDSLGRLNEATLNTPLNNGQLSATIDYQYSFDAGNEVTQQVYTTALGYVNASHYLNYTYDNIGQLRSAQGYESDGTTPRLQEQFGYTYDRAWNLNYRTNNALVETYNVNPVNELSTISRSGTLTVAGTASEPSGNAPAGYNPGVTSVTVNGQAANLYADGSFAAAGMAISGAGYFPFTAIAQDNVGRKDTNTITYGFGLHPSYSYDANGNLLGESSQVTNNRSFAYDDENQLTSVWVTNVWRDDFVYDGLLRKRIEKDYGWTGSAWQETNEVRFIYDGYVVIQERDANNLPRVTYTRGLDLGGNESPLLGQPVDGFQGAGGIGGLLARTDMGLQIGGNSQATAFYVGDGQGNIVAMVNTNGAIVAQYQYDPFGNTECMSGPLANANRYRFSSKEWNDGPNIYYYGYRFYDPILQRWLNRDPIEERGGINLYAFVANNPFYWYDMMGLCLAPGLAADTTFFGTGESLGVGALGTTVVAPLAVLAVGTLAVGIPLQAFINGLPAETTFYNPQVNYINVPPSSLVLASNFNPGYWPGPSGAAEWGRRNPSVGSKEARRRFHDIKQGDNMSEPPHNYGVNPNTGDVQDPKGDSVGNLNDCHSN
jgi:RHS repeat-associated protein